LVIESINITQSYQAPVILLSDQWLGQTLVATSSEFMEKDYPRHKVKRPVRKQLEPYSRYELTRDLVSPMAAVGDAGFVYQTTGLTHGEEGTPAFDFHTHQTMHEKRWQKLMPLCQRDELVKLFGEPEYRRGIVTWGSSAQIVLETIRGLGLQDKVKVCVPELIYPLPDTVESFVKSCEKLLVVEMNYSGQFYHYLRSLVDLPEKTSIYSRAGGRPFSKEELAGPISEKAAGVLAHSMH
jgi:2-oxoglutarate ferredoxin oxidoreductase subunit alpha